MPISESGKVIEAKHKEVSPGSLGYSADKMARSAINPQDEPMGSFGQKTVKTGKVHDLTKSH